METLILHLYGLWFWMTRKFRMESYQDAAVFLEAAYAHLEQDFIARASTLERGHPLPDQIEALALLQRHSTIAERTAQRLGSLAECCRFVIEELTGAPARPAPIALPSRETFAPAAVRSALTALVPDTRSGAANLPLRMPALEAIKTVEALPKAA